MSPNNPNFVYVVAAGFALLIGLIGALIYFAIANTKEGVDYDAQLNELLSDENEKAKTKVTVVTRWNRYWGERFKLMGWAKYADDDSKAGRDVVFGTIGLAVVFSIVAGNPVAGLIMAIAFIALFGMFVKNRANKAGDKINAQLPGFLFAMKANVQANETPERAILKIVDNMPSPLYEDLLIVKKRLLANSTFAEALEELGTKTSSRDLKFLCACMVQAASRGTNLEGQITVIQEVLEARRKVSDELEKAVRSATPSIYVASVVLPLVFLVTYAKDPSAHTFWFHNIIAWAALFMVGLLWGAGIWFSKRMVDKIRNL